MLPKEEHLTSLHFHRLDLFFKAAAANLQEFYIPALFFFAGDSSSYTEKQLEEERNTFYIYPCYSVVQAKFSVWLDFLRSKLLYELVCDLVTHSVTDSHTHWHPISH